MSAKKMPTSAYGLWRVTTEGDCEGRSTRDLGTHEGFLDEIAFRLAHKQYYSLSFSLIDTKAWPSSGPVMSTKANVVLDISSGTWDMEPARRAEAFRKLLAGRGVTVRPGNYFASVELIAGGSPEENARLEAEAKRARALAKLSAEDRQALGI